MLREQTILEMQLRRFSERTQETYLLGMRSLVKHNCCPLTRSRTICNGAAARERLPPRRPRPSTPRSGGMLLPISCSVEQFGGGYCTPRQPAPSFRNPIALRTRRTGARLRGTRTSRLRRWAKRLRSTGFIGNASHGPADKTPCVRHTKQRKMKIFIGRVLMWLMAAFVAAVSAVALGAPISFLAHGISTLLSLMVFPGMLAALIVLFDGARIEGFSRAMGIRSALYGLVPTAVLIAGFIFGFGPLTSKLLAPLDVDPPQSESRLIVLGYLVLTAIVGIFNETRIRDKTAGA